MNEIQLSSDLNVITAEINSYKQVAGQAIFEIGRRLKHVKENDLVHGEWQKYCEETLEMSRVYANRYITVYNEFKNSNVNTSFGLNKLFQIATLPPEEREKEHVTSKGEIKTVDEMTVRELEEVKRKLRETEQAKQLAEHQAELARRSEQNAIRQLEEKEDKEPEIIEKEIIKEVIPSDVQDELNHMRKMIELSKSANEELQEQIDSYKMKDTTDFDEKAAEWELKKLQSEADRNATQIRIAIKQLNNKIAVSKYMYDAISVSNDYEKREMRKEINILKDIITGIEASLNNRREIN